MNKIIILLMCCVTFSAQSQTKVKFNSIMRTVGTTTMWDGYVAPIFGFATSAATDPLFPAKTLTVAEGDSVNILAWNISRDHHTIHLHGLDVTTINDGDPMTSFEIGHMEKFTYRFLADHAGTYIYHCHVADAVHLQMGMYGLLVVNAKGNLKTAWTNGPAFDKEYQYLFSELDSVWHNNPPMHDTINMTVTIPKYNPTYFLINGKSKQQLTDLAGKTGESIYMRLANIGYYDNQVIFPSGLHATIIDSDGRPLPVALTTDTVILSPGERYGVMLKPDQPLSDKIQVNYIDLNTYQVKGKEELKFVITNPTGVNESYFQNDIKVYPNPSGNEFCLEVNGNTNGEPLECSIKDNLGRTVKNFSFKVDNLSASKNYMSVQDLAIGVYILEIKIGEVRLIRKLLVAR